jgi:PKD repeat protein
MEIIPTFNTTTDIPVAEFSWDFGDGVTIAQGLGTDSAPEGGTIKNPVHAFPGPGAYPVTVTSFTAAGCNNPFTKNITILEYLTHTTAHPILWQVLMVVKDIGQWRM